MLASRSPDRAQPMPAPIATEPPRSSGNMAMAAPCPSLPCSTRNCLRANAPAREAAIAAALAAIAGEPYHDARTGRTISGGWFSPLPRLEAILLAVTRVLRSSMPPATRTPPKRDDYPRSTLAREVEGYDPEGDPIAAYLASCPQ